MAKLTGFMDYTRKTSTDVPPLERMEERGLDGDQAQIEAFYAVQKK